MRTRSNEEQVGVQASNIFYLFSMLNRFLVTWKQSRQCKNNTTSLFQVMKPVGRNSWLFTNSAAMDTLSWTRVSLLSLIVANIWLDWFSAIWFVCRVQEWTKTLNSGPLSQTKKKADDCISYKSSWVLKMQRLSKWKQSLHTVAEGDKHHKLYYQNYFIVAVNEESVNKSNLFLLWFHGMQIHTAHYIYEVLKRSQ